MDVPCGRCGQATQVDGLALLQEGASDLELDWGDRAPPTPSAKAAPLPSATVPVVRVAPPRVTEEPPRREAGFSLGLHPADLAGAVAAGALTLGAIIEGYAAAAAALDAVTLEITIARYLADPRRFTVFLVAAAAFALWRLLGSTCRASAARGAASPLGAGGFGTLFLALACLLGWLAWSSFVLRTNPPLSRPGFVLECLLCLTGAAAYLKGLFLLWEVKAEDRRLYALEGQRRLDSAWEQSGREASRSEPELRGEPPRAEPPPRATERAAAPRVAKPEAPPTNACPACGAVAEAARCAACGAARRVHGARMLRVLSQKPHARTYLADGSAGCFVLKELAFALVPDATGLAAFEREAELLRQLEHPKIPRFLDSFREGEGAETRFYLAQEYVEGRSLEQELRSHRYSEDEIIDLLEQVLRVLSYLHGLSPLVLHRDLKPANLIRRSDGAVVLVDFGAAREGGSTLASATLVGTFGYMPPEQLAGQVDETSDLFALGMTALHLLTRRPPWELFADDPDVFPKRLRASPPLRRFLELLAARKRTQRIPTARRALAELGKVRKVRGRQANAPRWLAPAVAAAGALLALGGWMVGGSKAPPTTAGPGAEQVVPREAPAASKFQSRMGMYEVLFRRALGEGD
jgi:serine/threonine protein kinase